MPEFGFPAQPRHAAMTRMVTRLRTEGDDARTAAVTGRFADITAVSGGRVDEVVQLGKSIADLADYAQAIALSEARASTMQASLTTIGAVGQSLADAASTVLTAGTTANLETVSAQAAEGMGSVLAALNVSFAGRALFAGDDAGGAAVLDQAATMAGAVPFLEGATSAAAAYAALRAEMLGPAGFFETSVYLGGAGAAPSTEIAPGERVDYAVKANDPALRALLFNTAVMAAAFETTNAIPDAQRRELLRLGSEGMRNALSDLAAVEARLGTAEACIASVKARNIATEAALTLRYNDLAGADSYAAALELTELDRQLETAFATTARFSAISLANYL